MQRQMDLLEKMLVAAEAEKTDEVLRLDKRFDKIHLAEKVRMAKDLSSELDLARQSCVGAVAGIGMHNIFLKDARARVADLDGEDGK